jgi:hypothetical protein
LSQTSDVLSVNINERTYEQKHHDLLNQPTIEDNKLLARNRNRFNPETTDMNNNPIVQPNSDAQSKWHKNLIVHYTHEGRLMFYKKDIHLMWNQIFYNTPVINTRLIVGHRNSKNLQNQLVRRAPQPDHNHK